MASSIYRSLTALHLQKSLTYRQGVLALTHTNKRSYNGISIDRVSGSRTFNAFRMSTHTSNDLKPSLSQSFAEKPLVYRDIDTLTKVGDLELDETKVCFR